MLKNNILFCILCILCIQLVSAGLVVNQSYFETNKTIDQDIEINLEITNTESFPFYNITSSNQEIFELEEIEELFGGETKLLVAKIKANSDFSGEIDIIGFYEAQLGQQFETYNISIDYDTGIDDCYLTLIKGDKVNFNNLVNDEITLKNADTNQIVSSIQKNSTYTSNFDIPEIFRYYCLRRGFIFTDTCQITVLDDTGMINNPEYNARITLNLLLDYEPTTISVTFYNTDYSMNFYSSQDGVLTITNTGDKLAKDITIEADWFSFSPNNFDLEEGVSKNINYVINPEVYLTEETNKTHNKDMAISGNFETVYQNFSIFIEYANIEDGDIFNYSYNPEIIRYIILKYCEEFPNDAICIPKIIYKDINNTEGAFNVTYYASQVIGFYDFLFDFFDDFEVFENYMKDKDNEQDLRLISIESILNDTANDYSNLAEKTDESNSVMVFLGIFFGSLLAGGIVVFLILHQIKKNKLKQISEYK